jgi:hypothetical protein
MMKIGLIYSDLHAKFPLLMQKNASIPPIFRKKVIYKVISTNSVYF